MYIVCINTSKVTLKKKNYTCKAIRQFIFYNWGDVRPYGSVSAIVFMIEKL
jgi:hypothetical protein